MLNLLVADADDFERYGLRRALEAEGHRVFEAADRNQVLALAKQTHFDGAILDISLPADSDGEGWCRTTLGFELTRTLKATRPEMGLILFSAYEQHLEDFLTLLATGVRGLAYCLKGRRPNALLPTLKRVLAGRVEIDPEVHTRAHTVANELRDRLTPLERPWVERAVTALPQLTIQEARAAMLLAASCSPEGVARKLAIQRADNLICRVYAKLGLDTVPQECPELRQVSLVIKACHIHALEDHVV